MIEKKQGKVLEVFIPKEENVEEMYLEKIGFKVEVEDEVIEIIEESTEEVANIYKDDIVVISKQVISGIEYIDIELYDGELNE